MKEPWLSSNEFTANTQTSEADPPRIYVSCYYYCQYCRSIQKTCTLIKDFDGDRQVTTRESYANLARGPAIFLVDGSFCGDSLPDCRLRACSVHAHGLLSSGPAIVIPHFCTFSLRAVAYIQKSLLLPVVASIVAGRSK